MESQPEGFARKIGRALERSSRVLGALEIISHSITAQATREALTSLHHVLPGKEPRERRAHEEQLRQEVNDRVHDLMRGIDMQLEQAIQKNIEEELKRLRNSQTPAASEKTS